MADREKLIKLLNEIENHPEKTCPHFNDNDCFNCKYDTVHDRCDMTARKADYLIANGVTVQNQWISVDDRVPKNGLARVLVFLRDDEYTKNIGFNKIDTDRCVNGEWVRWGRHVTHWMPLPAPPKGA